MKDKTIIARKVQLYVVGDKDKIKQTRQYIKDTMEEQNKAMNQYISDLWTTDRKNITKDDRKELSALYGRISSSKKGSAYSPEVEFFKGLPMASTLVRRVKKDYSNACKKGLLYGNISLPSYKKDNPLLVHIDWVRLRSANPHRDAGLYHNYETHEEFLDNLYSKRDPGIYIKFANDITFHLVFGSPHKSRELRTVFQKIFEEIYEVRGSSIGIKDGKIILHLSMAVPVEKIELDENKVVGVDLGEAVPAYCALNNNEYIRRAFGDGDNFIAKRTQIKMERQKINRQLAYCAGGHGRKKKLKPMSRFKENERNYAKNYNHQVSKNVVQFAIDNRAKYINMEDLSGFGKEVQDKKKKKILAEWSYYQLQTDIKYKAERNGIVVRFVDPAYTSQRCSCCGEIGERDKREFHCINPKCKKYGEKVHADFNAARNIAMSTEFVRLEEK